MKKLLSPTFFALVVVAFLLPFVSVSCNASGFQEGLEGFGEGLGETGDFDLPQGDIEVTATGLQIILNDVQEPAGLGDLGADGSMAQSDFGGEIQQADPSGEDFPGRVFAILAAAAALLGLGLSFLRDRLGAIAAIALGAGSALFLFLMKNALDGKIGPAQLLGFQVSYEYGYWLALVFGLGAGIAGIWRLVSMRTVVVPPYAGDAPPPQAGTPPTAAPAPPD